MGSGTLDTSTAFDPARTLTIGASGMIGSYIDFGSRPGEHELNILNDESIERAVSAFKPTTIIHLAGATDMVRCESDPDYAFRLNAVGTYRIARAARRAHATLVYVSTSRVFDGEKSGPYTTDDPPEPRGAYAESKHVGEVVVQTLVPQHLVVRAAWVFGGGPARDNKFYGKVIRQIAEGAAVRALDDVHGSPTYGKDLIAAIVKLLREGKRGLCHVANSGVATRYDIAHVIATHMQAKERVARVQRNDISGARSLPDNESVASNVPLRPWQEALAEYLEGEWKLSSQTKSA